MLLNLPGVALMMALARRFIQKPRAAWMCGLLWAMNPFQIWHAQDVRNYAIWAVLSPLAMWLFLLALERNRKQDWILYSVALTASFYSFLLEPFFLLIQAVYLLLFHRDKWRNPFVAWAVTGIALIPWFLQVVRLSGSDYEGTASKVSLETLITRFIPTLLFGDGELTLIAGSGLLLVLIVGLAVGKRHTLEKRVLLAMWLFLPLILLTLAGTRLSIFRPRYIIPITPALLLTVIWISGGRSARRFSTLPALVMATLTLVSAVSLYNYFYTDPPKAPDWRSLAAYLQTRADENDIIVLANVDPAFRYYYRGEANDIPFSEIENQGQLTDDYRGVFVQNADSTFDISRYLQDTAQFIPPAIPLLKQYPPF